MINDKLFFLSIIAIFIIQSSINTACLPKKSETSSISIPVEVSQSNPTDKNPTTAKNNSSPPPNKNLSIPELRCLPKQIRKDGTLLLKMKSPHGGYLEIITPTKQYIFLSEFDGDKLVEDAVKAGATPFYLASEFTKLPELKISVSEATTTDYEKDEVSGKHQLTKIFSANGKYKILLSEDSFEQDDPTIEGQCAIELVK